MIGDKNEIRAPDFKIPVLNYAAPYCFKFSSNYLTTYLENQ